MPTWPECRSTTRTTPATSWNAASARETAARTVAGTLAKTLLAAVDISVLSHVVAIGGADAPPGPIPTLADLPAIDDSPVRAFGSAGTEAMMAEIEAAKADRDTLGGVVEVVVHGVMPGLGSHVHYDRRLDARLAGALMSIQAIKAVEIGDGFATAARRADRPPTTRSATTTISSATRIVPAESKVA